MAIPTRPQPRHTLSIFHVLDLNGLWLWWAYRRTAATPRATPRNPGRVFATNLICLGLGPVFRAKQHSIFCLSQWHIAMLARVLLPRPGRAICWHDISLRWWLKWLLRWQSLGCRSSSHPQPWLSKFFLPGRWSIPVLKFSAATLLPSTRLGTCGPSPPLEPSVCNLNFLPCILYLHLPSPRSPATYIASCQAQPNKSAASSSFNIWCQPLHMPHNLCAPLPEPRYNFARLTSSNLLTQLRHITVAVAFSSHVILVSTMLSICFFQHQVFLQNTEAIIMIPKQLQTSMLQISKNITYLEDRSVTFTCFETSSPLLPLTAKPLLAGQHCPLMTSQTTTDCTPPHHHDSSRSGKVRRDLCCFFFISDRRFR